jgi:hypothetical protein
LRGHAYTLIDWRNRRIFILEPPMTEKPRTPCPKCGKARVLSAKDKKVAALKCLDCEKIDPLKDPQVGDWINSSSLQPPR